MKRKAFVMSVHAGMEQEYEKRHSPIWPELEATLKKHGVHSYSIFLHPETRQLFGYVEIEDEERWAEIPKTAICQRWWEDMKTLMPSNPDNSPISRELKEVFHIQATAAKSLSRA
jgi:L-rhamnose mutarotase